MWHLLFNRRVDIVPALGQNNDNDIWRGTRLVAALDAGSSQLLEKFQVSLVDLATPGLNVPRGYSPARSPT